MRERMHFQRQPLLKPGLQPGGLRINRAGHNADRRAAVDLLQPIQDRSQKSFILLRLAHVVDGKYDDRLGAGFADPLRRGELGEISPDIKWLILVKVGQAIGDQSWTRSSAGRSRKEQRNCKERSD